jgi:nucleoside-diphosphate-sugar epimerase
MADEVSLGLLLEKIQPDEIYHLAGLSSISEQTTFADYFRACTLSTTALCDYLAKGILTPSVFFSSTVHVYGNQTSVVTESTEVFPENAYAMSKYLAEKALLQLYKKRPELKLVIGRLYSCIGPGQRLGFVTSDLVSKIKKLSSEGGVLETGPLDPIRRFLDVRDAVRLFPKLLGSDELKGLQIFNLSSPHELSIRELVEKLIRLSGKKVTIREQKSSDNSFRGLKLETKKLNKALPDFKFRSIDESLGDIWKDFHTT